MDTLTDHPRAKWLLLILDNCEHVADASAQLVTALLTSSPGLKVLTSSREALGGGGRDRVPAGVAFVAGRE